MIAENQRAASSNTPRTAGEFAPVPKPEGDPGDVEADERSHHRRLRESLFRHVRQQHIGEERAGDNACDQRRRGSRSFEEKEVRRGGDQHVAKQNQGRAFAARFGGCLILRPLKGRGFRGRQWAGGPGKSGRGYTLSFSSHEVVFAEKPGVRTNDDPNNYILVQMGSSEQALVARPWRREVEEAGWA